MKTLYNKLHSALYRGVASKDCRILIAEDHHDLADVIATLLRHCGFDVRLVHEGRVALAMASSFRPHFVVLDLILPGLSGHEVAAVLRADPAFDGLVIVGISAYPYSLPPDVSIDSHFDHHLVKPFALDALLSLLQCA